MSRMLAYTSPAPTSLAELLTAAQRRQLLELAELHAEGWGTAWLDEDAGGLLRRRVSTTALGGRDLEELAAIPSRARMLYLRFASRGAPARRENAHPFLAGSGAEALAFQHNGALSPIEPLQEMLDEEARAGIRGDTDSEQYFALLQQRRSGSGSGLAETATALRAAEATLRPHYPAASLNAFVLQEDGLTVLHSPGDAGLPTASFAARGYPPRALPPGHDRGYALLHELRIDDGSALVSSTGVDLDGWSPLPEGVSTLPLAR